MSDWSTPGRIRGEPPKPYALDFIDRDIIRLALRGDVDMRRYVPEVTPGRGSRGSAGAVWPLESPPCRLRTPR